MLMGCGEVIQCGGGHAFMGSELSGVAVGNDTELVVCQLPGSIESETVIRAGGDGVAEIISSKPTGKDRYLGQIPEQSTTLIGDRILP
jgi:hypothetical protein